MNGSLAFGAGQHERDQALLDAFHATALSIRWWERHFSTTPDGEPVRFTVVSWHSPAGALP